MENTEKAGGSRYSSGKAIRVWTPVLGMGEIFTAWGRLIPFTPLTPYEEMLETAHDYFIQAMHAPTKVDEDGEYYVATATAIVMAVLHELEHGEGAYYILPTGGLNEIAKVSVMGAEKYAPLDWREGQSFSTLMSSGHRHLCAALATGERSRDSESGLLHLAHFAWNMLCLLDFIVQGSDVDLDDVTPWNGITATERQEAGLAHDAPAARLWEYRRQRAYGGS